MSRGLNFGAIAQEKAQRRADLLRAVARMAPDETKAEPEPAKRSVGFDGGARESVPIAQTHEQTLMEILSTRSADAGRWFGA